MTHKYAKLTKSELLLLVDQLEGELVAVRSTTFEGQVERFTTEVKLLGEDLVKLARYVFNAGAKAKEALVSLKLVKPQVSNEVEVLRETSFPY